MHAAVDPTADARGWEAGLSLGLRRSGARTVLAERRRYGPLAVQRPFYPEDGVCHVYLLHPPGGVVGGDALCIEVRVDAGAETVVTTPGATKFYRSGGAQASQQQHLVVADGATLEWLPMENIFFPGADVALSTRVDLHGSARVAVSEIQCLGRPAINEIFDSGYIDSRLSIYRDEIPILLERLRVGPDNRCRLSLMQGLAVGGTLVVSNADETTVEACRDLLFADSGDYAGATLVDDLLVVRYLGNSTQRAHALFRAVWTAVRPATLGRPACAPRIWAT